jgi:type II secretory pathway predicted ATPase ExeA
LEELGLLARLQYKNRWLLQTILVGQQLLGDLIATSGVEHLSSRIVATSHLEPLDLNETVTYVVHRLCKAGWQRDPNFDEDLFRLIHKFSSGIPRRINLICSRLLLNGAMEEKHMLGGDDARIVIEGLQKEQLVPSE